MAELKRSLNLFDAVMLVSGSMIGSGIFIVSADMTRLLGSPFWVLMCWVISGVITLFAGVIIGPHTLHIIEKSTSFELFS